MPIEGPLRELSIQDVLQMLDLARKSGVLTVRSQRLRDEAVVHLRDGELVFECDTAQLLPLTPDEGNPLTLEHGHRRVSGGIHAGDGIAI